MSATQGLSLGYSGRIVGGIDIVPAPQQGRGMARFAAWLEDVHPIFCHAERAPMLVVDSCHLTLRDYHSPVLADPSDSKVNKYSGNSHYNIKARYREGLHRTLS